MSDTNVTDHVAAKSSQDVIEINSKLLAGPVEEFIRANKELFKPIGVELDSIEPTYRNSPEAHERQMKRTLEVRGIKIPDGRLREKMRKELKEFHILIEAIRFCAENVATVVEMEDAQIIILLAYLVTCVDTHIDPIDLTCLERVPWDRVLFVPSIGRSWVKEYLTREMDENRVSLWDRFMLCVCKAGEILGVEFTEETKRQALKVKQLMDAKDSVVGTTEDGGGAPMAEKELLSSKHGSGDSSETSKHPLPKGAAEGEACNAHNESFPKAKHVVEPKPAELRDTVTTPIAIERFHVTAKTLRRHLKAGTLTDMRKNPHHKNAVGVWLVSELRDSFLPRDQPAKRDMSEDIART